MIFSSNFAAPCDFEEKSLLQECCAAKLTITGKNQRRECNTLRGKSVMFEQRRRFYGSRTQQQKFTEHTAPKNVSPAAGVAQFDQ